MRTHDLPPRAATADGFRNDDERRMSKQMRRTSLQQSSNDHPNEGPPEDLFSHIYAQPSSRPYTPAAVWTKLGATARASSPSPSPSAMKALLKRRNVAWGSSRRASKSPTYRSSELAWHPFLKNASSCGLTGSLGYDEVLPLDFEPTVFDSEVVERLFLARCEDIKVDPTRERLHRFYELLQQRCNDDVFDLRDCGLGPSVRDNNKHNNWFCRPLSVIFVCYFLFLFLFF